MAVSGPLDEGQVAPEDIGAMLRNAREAAGYSIADVAQRLRLSRHHIENLEAERFDLFPVSVFLRGYLTSYARLLGIDSEPLLEAYDRRGFGPPQLHSQDSDRSTGRGSEFTVTITTLIVIAVLIVLSALWWREQWNEDDVTNGSTVEQTDRDDLSAGVESGLGESDEFRIPVRWRRVGRAAGTRGGNRVCGGFRSPGGPRGPRRGWDRGGGGDPGRGPGFGRSR